MKYNSIQIWPLFGQFRLYDVKRFVKFSNFGKNDGRSNFSPQKIYMVPSLELSVVVRSRYIALVF